ncbi:YitT family protein [Paenibacillus xanthanilyticus]|uniref:YitT family protein n=1 Tax=Paenibacillus xanthanilyticus TaxID=1783531 RepID=A0ABV8K9S7_9BACL
MSIQHARTAAAVALSSLLIAFGFNQFLIPHQMISGGVSGITMIISYGTGLQISWLYFVLNIPVLLWGWKALGVRFVAWSVFSVITTTLALQFVPVKPVVDDLTLGAVFGGIIVGFGSGLTLREGASSGGFDIVAAIISRKRDMSLGMLVFLLNGLIIAGLGAMTGDWDIALFSLVSIFTTGKIIDLIHISHIKITAYIITNEPDAMIKAMLPLHRGVTIIRTRGAYTQTERDMLMTVTTRYELAELKRLIEQTDPRAFVNLVETVGVIGQFRR